MSMTLRPVQAIAPRVRRGILLALFLLAAAAGSRGAALFNHRDTALAEAAQAPVLQSPPDGVRLTAFVTTLTWSNPPGATQYYLEVVPPPSVPGGPPDG